MDRPQRYYMLVASLPYLPPLFAANKPPMSRERLENRLEMLAHDDRQELTKIEDLMRELAKNGQQTQNSAYARHFQKDNAHEELTAEGLAGWVSDEQAKKRYVEAFQRSDFEAMLNYYKANYPRPPYKESTDPVIKVQCPTLVNHGLRDKYLLSDGLNNNWEWVAKDLTLVTVPDAAHFVQHDAPGFVNQTMKMWLNR